MDYVSESLEAAITELTILLDHDDAKEKEFQSWFERHPVAWEALGFQRSVPRLELNLPGQSGMILDFLAERPNGLWEIVELKRPDTAVLKNPERRTTFYSAMESYISQCREYSLRCSDSAVSSYLMQSCGMRVNGWPHCIIIAGRSSEIDRVKVHELLRHSTPKVSHYTYDDVLNALHQHYSIKLAGTRQPGLNIFLNVYLPNKTSNTEEFIFDLGGVKEKGRVSVVRSGDDVITFLVVDSDGLRFSQDIRLSRHCDKNAFTLGLRTTKTQNTSWIFLEINGTYVGQHELTGNSFSLEKNLPFVLAADMSGENTAAMFSGSVMFVWRTLSIVEHSMIRELMLDDLIPNKHRETFMRIRYHSGRFFYSGGHPILDPDQSSSNDMVQRNPDLRPSATNWTSSNAEYTEVEGSRIGLMKSSVQR